MLGVLTVGMQEQLIKTILPSEEDRTEILRAMKATFNLVCAMSKSSILTFGKNGSDLVTPHDWSRVPYIITTSITDVLDIDVREQLNKACTHGHIKNLGENAVLIRCKQVNGPFMNFYELAPGDVLDISTWASERVEIRPGADGSSRVAVLIQ